MDSSLIVGLLVGAGAAGAAVYFALNASLAAEKQKARAAEEEAERRGARTASEKVAAETAAAKAEVERARIDAEAAKKMVETEREQIQKRIDEQLVNERQRLAVEGREAQLRARQDAEKALEDKRVEVTRAESRIDQKERALDQKVSNYDKRESEVAKREDRAREIEKKVAEEESRYQSLMKDVQGRLERAAGLSSEQARHELIESITEDAKRVAARNVTKIEAEATEDAEARAKRVIGIAIQRYAGGYACDRLVSVLNLHSDEMKGKIIGREGRNIRALEAALGIDIIIDDTPETIVLSGYNPVRREVARRTIDELLKDGRIHPGRIEEVVHKKTDEVDKSMKEFGEKAMFELGISGLHPEVVKLMGSLRYRSSYSQNQWEHSLEVGFVVGAMAAEMKLNVKDARRAGFLHDLGKAVSHEVEGGHAVIGADLAQKYGEKAHIVHAIRAHHDDVKPETVLAHLVAAGDAISGARPGARSENLDQYVKRMEELERISMAFPGVERAFAVQAGREMRVIVDNSRVNDEGAVMLSRDIAREIEEKLTYPGQIKVTVIRETRAVDIAR